MKRFAELTDAQKAIAIEKCLVGALEAATEGLRFMDDETQDKIDLAGAKANAMHTPWFWSEYIMDTCRQELTDHARATAEEALYSEPDEMVIAGVI